MRIQLLTALFCFSTLAMAYDCGCMSEAKDFASKLENITQGFYQGSEPEIETKVNYVRKLSDGTFIESIRVDYRHTNEDAEFWTNRYTIYYSRVDSSCYLKRYLMYRK